MFLLNGFSCSLRDAYVDKPEPQFGHFTGLVRDIRAGKIERQQSAIERPGRARNARVLGLLWEERKKLTRRHRSRIDRGDGLARSER